MTSMLKSTTAALEEHVQDVKNELIMAELEQEVYHAKKSCREAEDIDPTSADSAALRTIWLALCVELKEVKEFKSNALVIAALEREVAAAKAAYTAADAADADNTTELFQTYQTMKAKLKAAVIAAAAVSDATPEGETKEEVVLDLSPEGALRVEAGLNSFSNALKKAKEHGIQDIYLLNGVHDERGEQVIIDFALSVIGENKEEVKIRAGLKIKGKAEEHVFFSDCTVTGAKHDGVYGNRGAAFHLKNVCVEKCGKHGVSVACTRRNTMTDCNVNNNKQCGVWVWQGGRITIDGSATTVHHNVTGGSKYSHGLDAAECSASIHLKSLTKESISTNNGGGGNFGGIGTIKDLYKPKPKKNGGDGTINEE